MFICTISPLIKIIQQILKPNELDANISATVEDRFLELLQLNIQFIINSKSEIYLPYS